MSGDAGVQDSKWPGDVPWSADLVERAVVERFESALSEDVRRTLSAADDLGPRVKLAVIWLSKGDPKVLGEKIADARGDWRDVLYWAEYEWGDYRKALDARGGFSPAELKSPLDALKAASDLPRVERLDATYVAWVWHLVAATGPER